MYDMEFILPVCGRPVRFLERLNAFKKYGIMNLKDYKIRVVLLRGCQRIPELTENWPCDVRVESHEWNHPAPKIYAYFASLKPGYEKEARWFFKVDDDSMTNVGGLIEQLDNEYDYKSPYYLLTDAIHDLWGPYKLLLRQMDLHDKFFPPKKHGKWTYLHEWEGCIISQVALGQMLRCTISQEYLEACGKVNGGYGDHALAIAARMSNVHPLDVPFMTKDPAINDFSIFGGRHHHIHYIAPDKVGAWAGFMNRYLTSKQRQEDQKKEQERIKTKHKPTPREAKQEIKPVEQKPKTTPKIRVSARARASTKHLDKFSRKLNKLR
jgi:hypothetical protein